MNGEARHFIRLPNGKAVTVADYVVAWKRLLTLEPQAEISGWQWYPVTAREALRDIRAGILDRINRKAGLDLGKEPSQARVTRQLVRRVSVTCRWCGQTMPYRPVHARFCDAECRHSFNS